MTPQPPLSPCLLAPTPLSVVPPSHTRQLEPPPSHGHVIQPPSTPLQPLNDLAETKTRMALYRDEMVLARNAEGRVRSQRDQYKALRNTAIEEKSALEKRLATTEALLQEERETNTKAKADFIAETQHLHESLRAAESDRDGYSRSLKTSQEDAEKARQSWVGEKEELSGALLAAQSACKTAEVGRSGMASQLMVALSEQGDVEQDLAALQEEANDLRRSLANAKEEAKKGLETRQNELDIVYLEKETLLRTRDDITVKLTALRKEVDVLRRSLSDAKDQEREATEALKGSQKHLDHQEEITEQYEAMKDFMGALKELGTRVKVLIVALLHAEEKQVEAADEVLRVSMNTGKEYTKLLSLLKKRCPSLAETSRLPLTLDNANKCSEESQIGSEGERKRKTSVPERTAHGDEPKVGRAVRNKLKRKIADAPAADKVPLRKRHQVGTKNQYADLALSFKPNYRSEANPRPAKVTRHD